MESFHYGCAIKCNIYLLYLPGHEPTPPPSSAVPATGMYCICTDILQTVLYVTHWHNSVWPAKKNMHTTKTILHALINGKT